jgi:hypothetical protein
MEHAGAFPRPSVVLLKRLLRESKSDDRPPVEELHAALDALNADDLRRLFEEWTESDEKTVSNYLVLARLVERWAVLKPEEAWTAVNERWAELAAGMNYADVRSFLSGLSEEEKNIATTALIEGSKAIPAALRGWAAVDPAAAFEAYLDHRDGMNWNSGMNYNKYVESVSEPMLREWARVDPEGAREAFPLLGTKALEKGTYGFIEGLPQGWDWAAEAKRFDEHPLFVDETRGGMGRAIAGRFAVKGSERLALRWVQDDPNQGIEWFCDRPTYYNKWRPREEVAATRTGRLLAELYNEQPQVAVSWVRDHQTAAGAMDQAVVRMLQRATSLEAVTQALPLVRSEEVRYAYLEQRASPLNPRHAVLAHNGSYVSWTPNDLQAALAVADLSPEHVVEIQQVIDNPIRNSFVPVPVR